MYMRSEFTLFIWNNVCHFIQFCQSSQELKRKRNLEISMFLFGIHWSLKPNTIIFCKNWPQLNDLKRSVQQYCTIVHATRSCFIVPYSTCIWQVKWRETVFNTRFDETICVLTTSAYRNAIVWLSFVILMGLIRISSAITIHEMLWFVYSTFSNIIFRNSFWTRFFLSWNLEHMRWN